MKKKDEKDEEEKEEKEEKEKVERKKKKKQEKKKEKLEEHKLTRYQMLFIKLKILCTLLSLNKQIHCITMMMNNCFFLNLTRMN